MAHVLLFGMVIRSRKSQNSSLASLHSQQIFGPAKNTQQKTQIQFHRSPKKYATYFASYFIQHFFFSISPYTPSSKLYGNHNSAFESQSFISYLFIFLFIYRSVSLSTAMSISIYLISIQTYTSFYFDYIMLLLRYYYVIITKRYFFNI